MINSYSYKPSPVFGTRGHQDLSRNLTFGVELECDSVSDVPLRVSAGRCSDMVDDATDRVYCKHDGSLSRGFEIVSHPGTLEHHTYELRWKQICRILQKSGFRSHDTSTAGLHIHVGRKQLGGTYDESCETVRKLTILVYRFWPELVNFSRRRESALEQWAPRPHLAYWYNPALTGNEVRDWARREIPVYDDYHDHRYTALNVTNNDTVEFRIFRGTLQRDTLIAALQLVSNLCRWAMTHDWDEVQSARFIDVAACTAYPELNAYLIVRNLAAPDAIPAPTIATRHIPAFAGIDGIPAATAVA